MKNTKPNNSWILHREEVHTALDGTCNIYALLDANSGFCFGIETLLDLPSAKAITKMLKKACEQVGKWPEKILISKKNPSVETLGVVCDDLDLIMQELPDKDLRPFVSEFSNSFSKFKTGQNYFDDELAPEVVSEKLEDFIPDSYSLCPCASGKKFRFCCQTAFKDITFAMCAAEEGHLEESLHHMKEAENKVGRTAEIVCRLAICWSFFDEEKYLEHLNEAIAINPNHPRVNYLFGIDAVAAKKFDLAVIYYTKAIENYPAEDKFHLNETYNNLGTAYFNLKNYKQAKGSWEKGCVLLPSDRMVKENLFEFIYDNPDVPAPLRKISPYMKKFLHL